MRGSSHTASAPLDIARISDLSRGLKGIRPTAPHMDPTTPGVVIIRQRERGIADEHGQGQ